VYHTIWEAFYDRRCFRVLRFLRLRFLECGGAFFLAGADFGTETTIFAIPVLCPGMFVQTDPTGNPSILTHCSYVTALGEGAGTVDFLPPDIFYGSRKNPDVPTV
jgi:hypothetical protein